jgi:hypothetical protein
MLWFYEREKIALRLETRYDNKRAEYVALLHHPDGQQEVHRFRERASFSQFLLTLEQTLTADRWIQKGSPDILPEGWPDKPPLV